MARTSRFDTRWLPLHARTALLGSALLLSTTSGCLLRTIIDAETERAARNERNLAEYRRTMSQLHAGCHDDKSAPACARLADVFDGEQKQELACRARSEACSLGLSGNCREPLAKSCGLDPKSSERLAHGLLVRGCGSGALASCRELRLAYGTWLSDFRSAEALAETHAWSCRWGGLEEAGCTSAVESSMRAKDYESVERLYRDALCHSQPSHCAKKVASQFLEEYKRSERDELYVKAASVAEIGCTNPPHQSCELAMRVHSEAPPHLREQLRARAATIPLRGCQASVESLCLQELRASEQRGDLDQLAQALRVGCVSDACQNEAVRVFWARGRPDLARPMLEKQCVADVTACLDWGVSLADAAPLVRRAAIGAVRDRCGGDNSCLERAGLAFAGALDWSSAAEHFEGGCKRGATRMCIQQALALSVTEAPSGSGHRRLRGYCEVQKMGNICLALARSLAHATPPVPAAEVVDAGKKACAYGETAPCGFDDKNPVAYVARMRALGSPRNGAMTPYERRSLRAPFCQLVKASRACTHRGVRGLYDPDNPFS